MQVVIGIGAKIDIMPTKKIEIACPAIVGVLGDEGAEVPRPLELALKEEDESYALLPFGVERRHLKNTVACMQLMDIRGLVIAGRHQRSIAAHLPRLDELASLARAVDVVTRRGRRFTGHSAMGHAVQGWLSRSRITGKGGGVAIIAGNHDAISHVAGALVQAGWKVHAAGGRRHPLPRRIGWKSPLFQKASLFVLGGVSAQDSRRLAAHLKKSAARPAVINMREPPNSLSLHIKGPKLGSRKLMSLFYLSCVRLLTSGKTI